MGGPATEWDDWHPEAESVALTHAGTAFGSGLVKKMRVQGFDVHAKWQQSGVFRSYVPSGLEALEAETDDFHCGLSKYL